MNAREKIALLTSILGATVVVALPAQAAASVHAQETSATVQRSSSVALQDLAESVAAIDTPVPN